ncbi:MAG: NAD(P)H-dependent oxidoreductase [Alphaproteobacteria bacterium]
MKEAGLNVLVVYGSMRRDRRGIRLARFLLDRLEARDVSAELADAMEIELPLLDRMYKEFESGAAPEPMERLAAMIRRADAVLVVAGEYNHGIQPGLKNLLDHFLEEWFFRPAGIACYSAGRFGGVRAAMQLRMTLAELGMPTISSLLPVPSIDDALSEAGAPGDDRLVKAADRFLDELLWWAEAAKRQKESTGAPF